jgi:hypothetical protein
MTSPMTRPVSFPTTLPAAILETILARLATLFLIGASGDSIAARQAASHMLAAYRPETEDELRLAANIICFSFQALEALSQAAAPDISLTRILRLRGGAVSLSRESAKAERRLGQLQQARQQPIQAPSAEIQPETSQPEPAQPNPKIEKTLALIQDTTDIAVAAKDKNLTWTQAFEQRQRDTRIAASLERARIRVATQANAAIQGALPGRQPPMGQAV